MVLNAVDRSLPADFALPDGWLRSAGVEASPAERGGVEVFSVRWTPAALGDLAARLAREGGPALAAVGRERLLDAWAGAVDAFLGPGSPERRALGPALASLCRLSEPALAAGLEAVLGGVRGSAAERLFSEAARATPPAGGLLPPALVVLASNLPALAVQPLVAALALGRPVLLKSPSAEPLFAPAFAAAVARREPRLAEAVAAATWPGGDEDLEAPVLAAAGLVVAYGEQEALDDLARRAPCPVVGYGPKTSLAAVGRGVDPERAAAGLARDVALFDQRGCLSVAAVYLAGDGAFDGPRAAAHALAAALARALAGEAERLPPGPATAAERAAVQQARAEAEMRGLAVLPAAPSSLAAGTVIVDPRPDFHPSPGLRTVRVHPLADLASLPEVLAPWRGYLQGAALAGPDAVALEPALARLGLSRFAPPGDLHRPDATWHNGGLHPLAALGGRLAGGR